MAGVTIRLYTKEITQSIKDTASKRMYEAVNEVRSQVNVTLSGKRTGRTYKVPGTNRHYQASSPGEPPAQATGRLRQSVFARVEGMGNQVTGRVGTELPYGLWLDEGTKKMKPRPWLERSLDKAIPRLREIFEREWL